MKIIIEVESNNTELINDLKYINEQLTNLQELYDYAEKLKMDEMLKQRLREYYATLLMRKQELIKSLLLAIKDFKIED